MSWLTGWITSCFLPGKNAHERVSSTNEIVRNTTFDRRKDENLNNIHNNNLSQSRTTCNNIHDDSDKDFIVYVFEKDGPFDIVKDDKGVHKYARPLLLKGECQEIEIKHKHKDYEIISFESRNSVQSRDSSRSFSFPVLDCEWIGSPVQMPKSKDQQYLKKKYKAKFVRFLRFSWIKRYSLGDINITNNGACYGKVVEVSNKRTSRTKFNNTKRSRKQNLMCDCICSVVTCGSIPPSTFLS